MATTPQTVSIDGKDYPLDSLSDAAKAQLMNLRVTDQEIARLQQQLAIAQTARAAYAGVLKNICRNKSSRHQDAIAALSSFHPPSP